MIWLFDMTRLELKLPPPLITLLAATLCWLVSAALPQLDVAIPGRVIAATLLGLAGLIMAGLGVASVWRAGTTIEPTRPEASSALVTTGIYRVTRNPMYLGLASLLLGWLLFLSNIAALLVLPCFAAYMTHFQIIPEERALARRFPDQFRKYRRAVRRWI